MVKGGWRAGAAPAVGSQPASRRRCGRAARGSPRCSGVRSAHSPQRAALHALALPTLRIALRLQGSARSCATRQHLQSCWHGLCALPVLVRHAGLGCGCPARPWPPCQMSCQPSSLLAGGTPPRHPPALPEAACAATACPPLRSAGGRGRWPAPAPHAGSPAPPPAPAAAGWPPPGRAPAGAAGGRSTLGRRWPRRQHGTTVSWRGGASTGAQVP